MQTAGGLAVVAAVAAVAVVVDARRTIRSVTTPGRPFCCEEDLARLAYDGLNAQADTRPRLVGITYPRDTWWMRTFMRVYNLWQVVRRSPARYFVHRHARLERWMADAGYRNVHEGGIRIWRVVVYRRSEAAA